MKHFSIISNTGEEVAVNLKEECVKCLNSCNTVGRQIEKCPLYGDSRKQGLVRNSKSVTFLCCDETKKMKLFRDKLEGLSYAYNDLQIPKEKYESEAKINEQVRVNRLVHNLTSLNAHNIQEIYDFVPQEILSASHTDQLEYIQKVIKNDIRGAAVMFLRIAKQNVHMKTEFSIYKKMDRSDASIEQKPHSLQRVLMNVLHTFFVDFTNNRIFVEVENYYGKVLIDYETIQVALYHLIENASKYAKPETNILIQFKEILSSNEVEMSLTMTSLFLEEDEIEKIFEEGYSGKQAKYLSLSGDGIGMWRIQQMMKLNKGTIRFNNGKNRLISGNTLYGENQIILTFAKS